MWNNNQKQYKELFNKKNRYAGIGRQVPLRTEWFYNCASSNLVTYNIADPEKVCIK